MGIGSWLKNKFKKETSLKMLQISRIETPERIVETKIRPVRIPTILDIGERLALLSRDLSDLKQEMVSKSWFRSEYEDIGSAVIEKLEKLESKVESLNNLLKNLSNQLSNLSGGIKPDLSKESFYEGTFDVERKILEIILKSKKIRYKDISRKLSVSDPTLSKYLKILLNSNKIKRTRTGKAVFYEAV
ncbi:MAG: winged helix-turn-helix domain-containing protein [Candidatus Aenigmarchaeota archaeon]|nr:winged helix-turn-helix domain-containing protein [Candidatus Aenigmarchaeota archaeon]